MWDRVLAYGRMIKFSHSVFALPFAFSGVALASLSYEVTLRKIVWVAAAMVSARSAAMGFNRLADKGMDALNPRTSSRAIPAGIISVKATAIFVVISSAAFLLFASRLNPLCGYLAPVALAYLFFYSYTKRFTWTSHLFLGLAIGLGPLGGWLAIAGEITLVPLLLTLAVLTWVAGFDIIYACQDYDFDVKHRLCSLPQRMGIGKALMASRLLHAATFSLLLSLFFVNHLNLLYFIGLAAVGAILAYEQSLVKPDDLSRVNKAFFDLNAVVSVVYFVFTLGSIM